MVSKSLILCLYTRCIPLLYLCCKEKQLLLYLVSFGYFTCILINPRRILFSFSFEVFAIMLKGFFWLKISPDFRMDPSLTCKSENQYIQKNKTE